MEDNLQKTSNDANSCSSAVRVLVGQLGGPVSIPCMSRSESAIIRGNIIMLIAATIYHVSVYYMLNLKHWL